MKDVRSVLLSGMLAVVLIANAERANAIVWGTASLTDGGTAIAVSAYTHSSTPGYDKATYGDPFGAIAAVDPPFTGIVIAISNVGPWPSTFPPGSYFYRGGATALSYQAGVWALSAQHFAGSYSIPNSVGYLDCSGSPCQ